MPTRVYKPAFRDALQKAASGVRSRDYELIVKGPTTEATAFTAIDDITPTMFVPTPGSVVSGNYRVEAVDLAERLGNDTWRFRVVEVAQTGTGDGDIIELPLEWRWEPSAVTVDTDTDRNLKPYVNSAGSKLDGTIPRGKASLFLRVWKRYDFFDVSLAYNILWRVNDAPVTINGRDSFFAGQMQCQMFQPVGNQSAGQESVRVEMLFEFKPGYKPFQPRALDQGYEGWYDQGSSTYRKGPFVNLTATTPYPLVQQPVLLDGTGAPFSTDPVYVAKDASGSTANVGVANPTDLTFGPAVANGDGTYTTVTPTGDQYIEIDPDSPTAPDAKVLIFDGYATANFSGFIPGLID